MAQRIAATVLLFILLGGLMSAQTATQTSTTVTSNSFGPESKFDPTRDPAQDLKAAIAQAKASNRRILLDVGGQWCIWCKYFDCFFDENTELRNFRDEHFVVMKVNFSRDNENSAFLSHFPKVSGYPHLFVLESDGKLLQSQNTDVLEQGKGYNPQAVSKFLHRWAKSQKS